MERNSDRVPAWLCVLTGWLLASTQLRDRDGSFTSSEIRERAPFGALDPPATDPDRMSPRELRGLPAIGPARALAIARARWEEGLTGGPEAWDGIPGIGPETVRSIRSVLGTPVEGPSLPP